ncbi:unnamed protein product [Pleuronectes platessa]|uniref:Uncharacterized protein n=1 Tax=Pleuronectes platessa TaxID=8262 RepID=A0A9N7Y814_PLEPL|nr:unnamed protein product [Pleuronectes platessa]
MLSPRWPSARATTGPLSGLPAQVACRLYVPLQAHTSASEGGDTQHGKLHFDDIWSFMFMGKDASQVVTQLLAWHSVVETTMVEPVCSGERSSPGTKHGTVLTLAFQLSSEAVG